MKPILFNTEMARAILDGRKACTRRVVKPPAFDRMLVDDCGNCVCSFDPEACLFYPTVDDCQYQPGDILYVRETWAFDTGDPADECGTGYIAYKADGEVSPTGRWRPSIHMPKEAARLFLRVTDVRVERLQDISMTDMKAEGVVPANVTGGQWQQWQREYMQPVWDSTIPKEKLPVYGWNVNPWVWVIEFKRISKEEALNETDL